MPRRLPSCCFFSKSFSQRFQNGGSFEEVSDFIYVQGPKGIGKTFHVVKALRDYQIDFSLNIYRRRRDFENLYNPNGKVIILDDFHYLCEYAKEGLVSSDAPATYLSRALGEKRPVIIISEHHLEHYAPFLNSAPFSEMIRRASANLLEATLGELEDYIAPVHAYYSQAKIEYKSAFLLLEASTRPRLLVRALNRLNGQLSLKTLLGLLDLEGLVVESIESIIPDNPSTYNEWARELGETWGHELESAYSRIRHLKNDLASVEKLQDKNRPLDSLYSILEWVNPEIIDQEGIFTLHRWPSVGQEEQQRIYRETKELATSYLRNEITRSEKNVVRGMLI